MCSQWSRKKLGKIRKISIAELLMFTIQQEIGDNLEADFNVLSGKSEDNRHRREINEYSSPNELLEVLESKYNTFQDDPNMETINMFLRKLKKSKF